MKTLQSLFVSHGAPTYAIEPGQAAKQLTLLGQSISRPNAVAIFSPHWMTEGVHVSAVSSPRTIHDFSGFPAELNAIHYPAPGSPAYAHITYELLLEKGWPATLSQSWGLDHGAWVPLRYLFPSADVPVFQVSMPRSLDAKSAWALGRDLASLAKQGIMVIGSGSLTHNLYEFDPMRTDTDAYVTDFVNWIREKLPASNRSDLMAWKSQAPQALRAHPSDEHFLPLLIAAGASLGPEAISSTNSAFEVLPGGVQYGNLSMESYAFY